MRKTWKIALVSGALLAAAAGTAAADPRIGVHISLGAPAPLYYHYNAPRVVYAPPQQVYYYPPAVYYAPAPHIVYRAKHPHWRHDHRHDRHDRHDRRERRDRGWR